MALSRSPISANFPGANVSANQSFEFSDLEQYCATKFIATLFIAIRVKRGKTERGVKRNTCIQPTLMKQGINWTTLYHRTHRYNLQRIHVCKKCQ